MNSSLSYFSRSTSLQPCDNDVLHLSQQVLFESFGTKIDSRELLLRVLVNVKYLDLLIILSLFLL
jgi:hypothetical protein